MNLIVIVSGVTVVAVAVGIKALHHASCHRARNACLKGLCLKSGFKVIEPDSYVLKSNRFGDIIAKDFLALGAGAVKISGGVIKYNLEESVILGDGVIMPLPGVRNAKPLTGTVILHLRKISVNGTVRIRINKPVTKVVPPFFNNLEFEASPEASPGFKLSASVNLRDCGLKADFFRVITDYGDNFPFDGSRSRGVVVINEKGWFIFGADNTGCHPLECLVELDRRIGENLPKKNV